MEERRTDYHLLMQNAEALLGMTENRVSNLANASALLYDALPEINWAGFYLMEEGHLILGPFQGKVACVLIEVGKGVCGTAVLKDATQLVADVHQFPGHIACDSASNSEIVVPLHKDGQIIGVMDIDSPLLSRFTEEDKAGLEAFARIVEKHV
ncbi:MAG: GAF domain-containing protein [Clostridia bacterium]|nr:GAF domain-containing protein [Clostridia bacterium]